MEIPRAREAFLSRLEQIPHRIGNGLMVHGIGEEKSDERQEQWMVATEVSRLGRIPDGMFAIQLRPAQYACYHHRESIYSIGDAYSELHRWIIANGDYADGCMVEQSDDRFQVFAEDSSIHVYAPFRWKEQ